MSVRNCLSSLLLWAALASPAVAAGNLDWPEITAQTKPWSRWWWLGNIGTKQDFSSVMEKYAKAGLGGLEITPIYGVRGQEDRFRTYLSPEWMTLLDHVLDEGHRLGLRLAHKFVPAIAIGGAAALQPPSRFPKRTGDWNVAHPSMPPGVNVMRRVRNVGQAQG